jgi:hypothetical protein
MGNSDLRRLRGILEIRAPRLFLPSPNIYSWRVSENLEASFIRAEPARVSVIQWGTPFSGKFRSTKIERDLGDSGTWVILTITRSINWHISWVIGHFWQQVRVIEGFILLLERGILQLDSLAFRSSCIDLHFLFSLWRHYFVLAGAFCSSSYLLLVRPSKVYAGSAIYCIDLTLIIIKRSDLCLCFYILNIL